MAVKSAISLSITVVLTTRSIPEPASVRMAARFCRHWRVWVRMSSPANAQVAGSFGIWPETYTKLLALTAWEYGPMAAGALPVWMAVRVDIRVPPLCGWLWKRRYMVLHGAARRRTGGFIQTPPAFRTGWGLIKL